MLVTCWSVKGGVGTSVVAAALATLLSRRHPAGALLVDAAGDQPAVLGMPDPPGPGLAELLRSGVDPDRLARIERVVDDHLSLVPAGSGGLSDEALPALVDALVLDARPVVVDAGLRGGPEQPHAALATAASSSLLVVRPCYLCLRRAVASVVRPTGIVVVDEAERALEASDVQDVVGVEVVAVAGVHPSVARAVDAGLLGARLPSRLARALAGAA